MKLKNLFGIKNHNYTKYTGKITGYRFDRQIGNDLNLFYSKSSEDPDWVGIFRAPLIGISVSRSGELYIVDSLNCCIKVYSSEGSLLRKFGQKGSVNGEFNEPRGIFVDQWGMVFVADRGNNRVQVFNIKGKFKSKWCNKSYGIHFVGQAGIVRSGGWGEVYVVNSYERWVHVFESSGFHKKNWVIEGGEPEDITISPEGEIYVAISGGINKLKLIKVFNKSGNLLREFSLKDDKNKNYCPDAIALSPIGELYIVSSSDHCILVFSEVGKFLRKWGKRGDCEGEFYYPHGIAIDGSGDIYVADAGNQRIQVFKPEYKG